MKYEVKYVALAEEIIRNNDVYLTPRKLRKKLPADADVGLILRYLHSYNKIIIREGKIIWVDIPRLRILR